MPHHCTLSQHTRPRCESSSPFQGEVTSLWRFHIFTRCRKTVVWIVTTMKSSSLVCVVWLALQKKKKKGILLQKHTFLCHKYASRSLKCTVHSVYPYSQCIKNIVVGEICCVGSSLIRTAFGVKVTRTDNGWWDWRWPGPATLACFLSRMCYKWLSENSCRITRPVSVVWSNSLVFTRGRPWNRRTGMSKYQFVA